MKGHVVNLCERDKVLDKSWFVHRAHEVTKRTIRFPWNRISVSKEGLGLLKSVAVSTTGQRGTGGA